MKNYNLKDYKNIIDLKADFIKDMNEDFADLEIISEKYTDCEILEITKDVEFNGKTDVMIDVSCNAGILSFLFRTAVNAGRLTLPEDKKVLFDEYFSKLDKAVEDSNKEAEEQLRLDIERAELEAERLAAKKIELAKRKAEQEADEKFKLRITKATEKFEHDIKARIVINTDIEEWLKENLVSISAVIPSHLESSFIKVFGDQPHKTVDSRRKTSGGYSMKFGPSFSLTIKKDATTIPAELTNLIKDNKIQNTAYIANLVRAYGFNFGKQN